MLLLPPAECIAERVLFLPQQSEQSEHQALALPGKAAVYIEVHAPSHFLVDLKAMSGAAKNPVMNAGRRSSSNGSGSGVGGGGGGRGGGRPGGATSQRSVEGDAGTSRLVDFLITVQQVSEDQGEGALLWLACSRLDSPVGVPYIRFFGCSATASPSNASVPPSSLGASGYTNSVLSHSVSVCSFLFRCLALIYSGRPNAGQNRDDKAKPGSFEVLLVVATSSLKPAARQVPLLLMSSRSNRSNQ